MSHLAADVEAEATQGLARAAEGSGADYGFHLRTKDQFSRFFDGLELVEPGIVPVSEWRVDLDYVVPFWAGVGRKP
jgi:hypothetical protein